MLFTQCLLSFPFNPDPTPLAYLLWGQIGVEILILFLVAIQKLPFNFTELVTKVGATEWAELYSNWKRNITEGQVPVALGV
jgi:hypothetical protein